MLTLVILVILLALVYDFLNGMNDAANSIATVVSTKVLSPRIAVLWAAFFNFAAIFFFGLHVATTMGKGIVQPGIIDAYAILASLLGAGLWVHFCNTFGLPISVSHALVGGLIGPALMIGGTKVLIFAGIKKIVLFIFLSPLIGFVVGSLMMILTLWIFKNISPWRVDKYFRSLQLFSSAAFSLGHGSNDAQKTMGIIAILLYNTGYLGDKFYVPAWVIIAAYLAIGLGTYAGGWKVIKTLGVGLTNLKPAGGYCAETAAASVLFITAAMGIPVSTTHTITGGIMGAGIVRRTSSVKWSVAYNIILAWIFTIPLSLFFSALIYWLIKIIWLR